VCVHILCAVLYLVKIVTSENCSADNRTSIDWSSATNNASFSQLGSGTGPTVFLANSSLQCKGSVNVWRLCLSVDHDGEGAMPTVGSVSFGVWRTSSDRNVTTYDLLTRELEVISPSIEFFSLDFFCMRHEAMWQVNVSYDDVVGVVTRNESSVFSVLSSSSGSWSNNCKATMGGADISCSSWRFDFYLEPIRGVCMCVHVCVFIYVCVWRRYIRWEKGECIKNSGARRYMSPLLHSLLSILPFQSNNNTNRVSTMSVMPTLN